MKTTLLWIPLAALLLLAAPLAAHAEDDVVEALDLSFKDTPVRIAITQIAEGAGMNVIVSPKVQGSVTLEMKDVTWRKALDQVAIAVGARAIDELHGVVRVVPADQVKGRKYAELRRAAELDITRLRVAELRTRLARATADGLTAEVQRLTEVLRKAQEEMKGAQTEGDRVLVDKFTGETRFLQVYDIGDLEGGHKRALEAWLEKLLPGEGEWREHGTTVVVRAPKAAQEHVRQLLDRLRQGPAADQPTIETITEDGEVRVRIKMDGQGRLIEKRVMKPDGKGGWVPVEAGADDEPFVKGLVVDPRGRALAGRLVRVNEVDTHAARKRIEDLMAAVKHLQAAGLNDEAKRLNVRIREAQTALAEAEKRRAEAETARRAAVRWLQTQRKTKTSGEPELDGSIQALRKDVQALRGEVRELTALVRKLLEQRDR